MKSGRTESLSTGKSDVEECSLPGSCLTVRGGTDKLRVSAGLNYFDQDGMVTTGSGYKKAAFRLNVDYKVNKWASFGVNTSYALSKSEREDGNFTEFITRTPLAKVYNADGSYTKYIDTANDVNPTLQSTELCTRNNE